MQCFAEPAFFAVWVQRRIAGGASNAFSWFHRRVMVARVAGEQALVQRPNGVAWQERVRVRGWQRPGGAYKPSAAKELPPGSGRHKMGVSAKLRVTPPRMSSSQIIAPQRTRRVFRVWAGIIAVFLLLVGLPCAISESHDHGWEAWFGAFCCLYGGIGMACGAWTGEWPYARVRHRDQHQLL